MIHVTYTTEHHNTKINSVEYCNENSDDETVPECSNTFCIGDEPEYIYLLVGTTEDDCCCMSGSTEHVEKVSNDLKKIIHTLMKKPDTSNVCGATEYDIRSYRLHNEASYARMYEQTYTIQRDNLECDDVDYVYIWLHCGEKLVPFPDESQEHFENKQLEYNSLCTKSKKHREKIKDARNKIMMELSCQIRQEKQRKKELLRQLNDICNLDDLKYQYVWEIENAPTTTEKILNRRVANIETKNAKKQIKII